ncbi:MAG TPA: Fur family transcriptional regulator [Nocardioidaceae bacterium]|nr:Fur family transcriptional regulator [Nocardioidaceae bacterium]
MRDDHEPRPDGWQDKLRASGYRLTPQRQLVLEAVEELGHATPEDVLQRSSAVNASTVYRTLDVLERTGLVKHAHLGHGAPTYHPATAPAHVHLVCRECDVVQEIDISAAGGLVAALKEQRGFETDVNHLTVFGRCADCRTSEPS